MKLKRSFFINFILYFFILLLLFPIFILLLWSFAGLWPWPDVLPNGFSLRGFQSIFTSGSSSLNALLNSIYIALAVTIITLAISIPAARALGLYEFRGKRLIKIAILAPIIVPTVSVSMGIHITFMKMGFANTFLGVVLVHLLSCLPYGVRILTNVFEIIGDGMEQQAKVLGAKKTQVFFNITLPLIMPGVLSAGSLIFIVSFSQYFLTFLIGGGTIITFPMIMFPYIQSGDRVIASSYSLVFLISAIILLTIMEKALKSYYKVKNHFYI
jgi:putative spermidine/putrescine transport system permease protein